MRFSRRPRCFLLIEGVKMTQSTIEPNKWKIIKRDGREVAFDPNKITQAIFKAGKDTGEYGLESAEKFTEKLLPRLQQITKVKPLDVETVQDKVEDILLASPYKKTAKSYILYREQRANVRQIINQNRVDLIDNYLSKADWKVQENSNMGYSLQGLNNYISHEISKIYWLNKFYTPKIRQAHMDGDFHIHDLGLVSVYCVGWDLEDLLRTGFCGTRGKVASKPAKHFRTALGQIVNFFYTLQGEAAGAQAFSSFDTLLAPFIRYDKIGYKDIKQALQEFIFNVNVPTRVGFQSPFTNVTIDLQPPGNMANQPVIIGGEQQDAVYGDFQEEMDLFNKAFLEVMTEGDANGRVFTFPIPTYNISKKFDWDAPGIEKLWKVTAKYGIPYFANFINSDMSPDDARSMCCRLRIDNRELEKRGGGLFGANPLTGSIGVVTLNMPRISMRVKNEDEFFTRLEELMELAKKSLEIKRKALEKLTEQGLYPYTKFYLRDIKQRNKKYWNNHFSTIGLVGMNEACLNLSNKDIGSEEGKDFAERVLDFMRDKLIKYQKETGHMYNLEATPAESTSYRLAKLDKVEDVMTYTNSSQLPVNYTDDVFKMLDLQDSLQTKYTGGTVQHIYLGEAVSDPESVKNFVKKVCENYELPYFSLTPTFSICQHHGYLNGEQTKCPHCDEVTEIYSRVVGYLRPVNQWNEGKQTEFKNRKLYAID